MSDIDNIESINDPNYAMNVLYDILQPIVNKHAPLKIKRVRHKTQPQWYSDNIKNARINRDLFHKQKDWINYKIWRNKVNSLIKKEKKTYFNNLINTNIKSNDLWKILNSVATKENNYVIPLKLSINTHVTNGRPEILNTLNTHFVGIAKCITKTNINKDNFKSLELYVNSKLGHRSNYFQVSKITAL